MIQSVLYITANIYSKSGNLPNTHTQLQYRFAVTSEAPSMLKSNYKFRYLGAVLDLKKNYTINKIYKVN